MSIKMSILRSTENYSDNIMRLKLALDNAEVVVIGAGAGLSTSAGFIYDGAKFDEYFKDFKEKYGFEDMYTGGFYPYDTLEEYWAYWSRYIYINRYTPIPKPVYTDLYKIVKNKEYFVITTNVDHCFQRSGFDKERLFYTQGDYGLFQCSEPCRNETFDNEDIIDKMIRSQKNMRIPSELIPICPHCGKPMTMNLRSDNKFVEDEGWHKAAEKYKLFLERNSMKKILFLELGVGYNTPIIIKYPFWQMTMDNKDAFYVCINKEKAPVPKYIENRSLCIDEDIGNVLKRLLAS